MSYDVLVFGSQLAGAVTAGLLAKRGYRVLAVTHDGLPTSYPDGPYQLPCGPSVLPPLRSMPAAAAVLEELGAATDVYRSLVPLSPPLQFLAEKLRLDVASDPVPRAAELRARARRHRPPGRRGARPAPRRRSRRLAVL